MYTVNKNKNDKNMKTKYLSVGVFIFNTTIIVSS